MAATVLLVIHAPTVPIVSERRLPGDVPLQNVHARLELLCGVPPEAQKLSLWSARTDDETSRATMIGTLIDETKTLLDAGAKDGMGLLLEDTRDSVERDQFGAAEEERVQKYEMDDEAYARRTDSVLAFKQRMKVGRFADGAPKATDNSNSSIELPAIKINSRCEVEGGRRGTVRFVGQTEFAKGVWIGVEYDEPVGKNDGSVGGKRYFSCSAKYGGFVKPEKVVEGDFPVRSIDEDLDDEDEEM